MERPQTYQTYIDSFEHSPNKNVLFLRIRFENQSFCFQEGQFIMMQIHQGEKIIKRSYSICTTYSEYLQNQTIGIIIKSVPGGKASEYFFNHAHLGEKIEIIGPLGHMTLPDNTGNKHFLLISTGSGLSPLYGIFKKLLESDNYSSIVQLYGEKTEEWLVPQTLGILQTQSDKVVSRLCLSRQTESTLSGHYHGYVGHCLEAMIANKHFSFKKGETYKVYICGKPETVEQIIDQLKGYGIGKEDIMFEKY